MKTLATAFGAMQLATCSLGMFVNGRHVTPAGSYGAAITMITEARREE